MTTVNQQTKSLFSVIVHLGVKFDLFDDAFSLFENISLLTNEVIYELNYLIKSIDKSVLPRKTISCNLAFMLRKWLRCIITWK